MRQRGFTIVELMVAVAILGVLAKLVLPAFTSESNKSKARSEVSAMFVEIATKEQQWKLDNASYLDAPACPAAPSQQPQDATGCVADGQPWHKMRVMLPETTLMCSYEVTVGNSDETPTPPSPFDQYTVSNSHAWYYIVATCDTDGDPSVNSTYFASSWDTRIRSANESK